MDLPEELVSWDFLLGFGVFSSTGASVVGWSEEK